MSNRTVPAPPNPAPSFGEARQTFDATIGKRPALARSLVPVNGQYTENIPLVGAGGSPLEEYYKWQFIYALINSGLYAKDYIGAEVFYPKGKTTLRIDAAIFDDAAWIDHYRAYWADRSRRADLEWLNDHLLAVVEFKREGREVERAFSEQVKPAMREKDPSDAYILGVYYDRTRLYLFHRRGGRYLRYDEHKNQKAESSATGDLSLHLPDPYAYIPSFHELRNRVHKPAAVNRANRSVNDLEVITSITTVQVQAALSTVLRELTRVGRFNQRGYHILIETFALKIFDEKRSQDNPANKLNFYITDQEQGFSTLAQRQAQVFIARMQSILAEAEDEYSKILGERRINWKDQNDVRCVATVCAAFQDFSFARSTKSDLYQLVFYNFANEFKRGESAQFLTPIPVIDFLVRIVNPRNADTVLDPCCGIGDFLSLSFVRSQEKAEPQRLDDANIFGVDVDDSMIMLATLNMLLNGDGQAKFFQKPDKGSIQWKIAAGNPPGLAELLPDHNKEGKWDDRPDRTRLMKFDVVLTNPPFGEDRAYRPASEADRRLIECYETWGLAGSGDNIDLGVVFLENAYHCLKEGGRLGIVLSNSIASIDRYEPVRKWLIERMRIVALFDLPANIFAETGVNTSLIVAYRPKPRDLARLNTDGYSVFVRDIHAVGYEKRTKARNVIFNPVYRIDEATFEVETDAEGRLVRDEDFGGAFGDFQAWALAQERELQRLFLGENQRP